MAKKMNVIPLALTRGCARLHEQDLTSSYRMYTPLPEIFRQNCENLLEWKKKSKEIMGMMVGREKWSACKNVFKNSNGNAERQ